MKWGCADSLCGRLKIKLWLVLMSLCPVGISLNQQSWPYSESITSAGWCLQLVKLLSVALYCRWAHWPWHQSDLVPEGGSDWIPGGTPYQGSGEEALPVHWLSHHPLCMYARGGVPVKHNINPHSFLCGYPVGTISESGTAQILHVFWGLRACFTHISSSCTSLFSCGRILINHFPHTFRPIY